MSLPKSISLIKKIKKYQYDGIIIAVKHNKFKKLGLEKIKSFGNKKAVIYDIKNFLIENKKPIFKYDIL